MTGMFSRFDYTDAALTTGERFLELVEGVDEPETRVPDTPGWTLVDCLGHVALAPTRFLELARGEGEWCRQAVDVPDFNAKQIANLPTREVSVLARQLRDDLDTLVDAVSHFNAQVPKMRFDGDRLIRADAALGILIGEFVVHGFDVARAVGARWWVEPEVVLMIVRGRQQIPAGWTRRWRQDTGPPMTSGYADVRNATSTNSPTASWSSTPTSPDAPMSTSASTRQPHC